jgi:hypothetical protein
MLNIEDIKQSLREQEENGESIEVLRAEKLKLDNELKRQKLNKYTSTLTQANKSIDYTILFSLITITISILISLAVLFGIIWKY